jgi:hypothetical protein
MGTSGHPSPERRHRDLLDELRRVLIDEGVRAVVVHGALGSGKTALAHSFAELHRGYSPGGVVIVTAETDASPLPALASHVAPTQPALIVLDEIDRVSVPSHEKELADLAEQRPNARLLMT